MKISLFTAAFLIISAVTFAQTSIVFDEGTSIEVGSGADICADAITINGTYSGSGTRCNGPLPVELTDFAVNYYEGSVIISWSTAAEINNFGFEVERNSGRFWEMIGFIKAGGNSNSPKNYSFTDNPQVCGLIEYRLRQIDADGKYKYYDAAAINIEAPENFTLQQNSPNPFNPSTAIRFQLPVSALVSLKVYDLLGREIASLVNAEKPAGSYIVYWNGKDKDGQMVSSGIYLYKLNAGNYSETRKMNLTK